MTPEELKLQIDTDITGKTQVKSITPTNVGGNMKNIIDLIPTLNLQNVLEGGATAAFYDGPNGNFARIMDGSLNNRYTEFGVNNGLLSNVDGSEQGYIGMYTNWMDFRGTVRNAYGNNIGAVYVNNGFIEMFQRVTTVSGTNASYLRFEDPISTSSFIIPKKTVPGNYTINTTPNNTYLVANLPAGILNDMAIVTDAVSPTYLGTLTGGGSTVTPVWYNGTAWVAR